jgi:membrane-associated phospholipid phosphatase
VRLSALTATRPFDGGADRLARAVSIVCCPPVLALSLVLLVGQHSADPSTLRAVLVLLVATAILPALFVYGAYRRGRAESLDLHRRSERLGPAFFAVLTSAAVYPLLQNLAAPPLLLQLSAALTTQLLVLALVTVRWKISYHAASAAGLAVLAWAIEDPELGLALAVLAGLVGWARVRLRRHTPAQVVLGLLSAVPIFWWVRTP